MTWRVIEGDALTVLGELPEGSVHAIVTDPPYGLEFMGREWDKFRVDPRTARWSGERSGGAGAGFGDADHMGGNLKTPSFGRRRETMQCRTCGKRDAFRNPHACGDRARWVRIPVDAVPMEARAFGAWCEAWGELALRVLRPGGHLLSFGGTRTHHRLAVALEEVGFEIRDTIAWLYGSGFPKSLDVSAAIDRAAGVQREVVCSRPVTKLDPYGFAPDHAGEIDVTEPATDEARRWDGWGTALKPGHEPITVARKPLTEGSVAANVIEHGTGALNIDAARLPISDEDREKYARGSEAWARRDERLGDGIKHADIYGLYRARDASGAHVLGRWPPNVAMDDEAAELVGADARFFFTAKASRSEREGRAEYRGAVGLDDAAPVGSRLGRDIWNDHPTVKPIDLMSWLVRLVTPPGGMVLDPFCGSGSTGIAATREGFDFVGIERDPRYVSIARERIRSDAPLFNPAAEDVGPGPVDTPSATSTEPESAPTSDAAPAPEPDPGRPLVGVHRGGSGSDFPMSVQREPDDDAGRLF
jgi:site-specific DNA-methyltransferase (adenine-specific)